MKLRTTWKNQPITATVGGKKHRFRSLFEWRWSQYLELLKLGGEIMDWQYEPPAFQFPDGSYRIDFELLYPNGRYVYHELKGHQDGRANQKLKLMAKYHPDIKIVFVRQRVPKHGREAAKLRTTAKYVERIIDAEREIFPTIRGMIQWNPPIVGEM